MEVKSSTAVFRQKPQRMARWSAYSAAAMFLMAMVIFSVYNTPAICYQLSLAFGLLFAANGLLGLTKFSTTKGWAASSYFIGTIFSLFGFASLFRQITKGQRGLLVGVDFYSILICLAIIGSLGLAYVIMAHREFHHH